MKIKAGDIVRLDYMLSGFNVARVMSVEPTGFTVRRAYVGAAGNAGFEELYFRMEDSIVVAGMIAVTSHHK